MKIKKLTGVVLSTVMAALFIGGCGSSESSTSTGTSISADTASVVETSSEVETGTDTSTEAAADSTDTTESTEEWDGDITEINLMLFDLRGTGDRSDHVIEAMNEITEKTIGVRVNVTWASAANYATTVTMAISSGEQLDVISIMPAEAASFNSFIANSQLMDITDLLNEYGQDTIDEMGQYIYGMSIDGRIYGVPCYRNYAQAIYLIMRGDILDDLGLREKAENMTTWSEAEEIWLAVKENTDLAPLGSTRGQAGFLADQDAFSDMTSFDTLGDLYNIIYCDDDGNVSLLYENSRFLDTLEEQRRYWDEGLVYQDILTIEEHPDTLTKANAIFSSIQASEMGVKASKDSATGYDEVCVELKKNVITSSLVSKFGLGIPVTSEEPEAAMRWINALMTDPELENLLCWGVEGVDYVVNDGIACFPEGESADTVYHSADFLYGNYFNALPWDGEDADFREQALEYLNSAEISPLMGFQADTSSIQNTMTAITSVYQEYYRAMMFGAVTDEDIEEYKEKMDAAGVDEYVNLLQEQVDEWKVAQAAAEAELSE